MKKALIKFSAFFPDKFSRCHPEPKAKDLFLKPRFFGRAAPFRMTCSDIVNWNGHRIFFVSAICAAVFLFGGNGTARANDQPFGAWLAGVRQEALSQGIRPATVDAALSDIRFQPRVIELDRKQPEKRLTFSQYINKVIDGNRINNGRRLIRAHHAQLNDVERRYGVPASVIVALWGLETSYGKNTGGFNVIEALATLAYDGRRSAYFRGELFKAMMIVDQGHIDLEDMRGSWAGAMGQNQFMPTSFMRFAVDGDGDGRRDIWRDLDDVFSSSAHYLAENGWRPGERWGREVKIGRGIPENAIGLETQKTVAAWAAMGVTALNGAPLPHSENMMASLIRPDGPGGRAFLVYENFRVIMRWNKSVYFASSVGMLSDLLASGTN